MGVGHYWNWLETLDDERLKSVAAGWIDLEVRSDDPDPPPDTPYCAAWHECRKRGFGEWFRLEFVLARVRLAEERRRTA